MPGIPVPVREMAFNLTERERMSRKPELHSFSSTEETWDKHGNVQRRNGIFARICLTGIKGEPIEAHELTRMQALRLMSQLAAVLRADEERRP